MTQPVTASTTFQLVDQQYLFNAELAVANELDNAAPCQVQTYFLPTSVAEFGKLASNPVAGVDARISVLAVTVPGKRRIEVYGPNVIIQNAVFEVDNGMQSVTVPTKQDINYFRKFKKFPQNYGRTFFINTVNYVGTRSEKVQEIVTFNSNSRSSLRYWYDQPEVVVLHATTFRDKNNNILNTPLYDRLRGEFYATAETWGSLLVEYYPVRHVYDVTYGNGQNTVTANTWTAMQKAWLTGNVYALPVPPVRVILKTKYSIHLLEFERAIWPAGRIISNYSLAVAQDSNIADNGTGTDDNEPTDEEGWKDGDNFSVQTNEVEERVYDEEDPDVYVTVGKVKSFRAQSTLTGIIDTYTIMS